MEFQISPIEFEKYTGKGIRIAVIDSGIDMHHPLFYGRNIVGRCFLPREQNLNSEHRLQDTNGHGTACVGIIIQKAPLSDILIGKIFNSKLVTSINILCDAIQWAVDNGVKVINLSVGALVVSNHNQLEEVCRHAFQNEVIIVAAAHTAGYASYPSHYPFVLGVKSGNVTSKYGFYYRVNHPVELVACGGWQKVAWTQSRYVFRQGSSFAAPHITGIIALVLEAYPHITIEQLKHVLACNGLPGEPIVFTKVKSF